MAMLSMENPLAPTGSSTGEVNDSQNPLLADLVPRSGPASYGGTYNGVPPGEVIPNRPLGGPVPIGNVAGQLSNYHGNKFTRGWLSGAGGADIDQNLGSLAFDIRPAPYNSRIASHFRAVVPEYGAKVAGLASWDVNAPGRTFGPLQEARAEWIPSTWDSRLNGLDIVSGNVGPRVYTADQKIIKSPTPQYYAYAQVPDGGDAPPISAFSTMKGRLSKPPRFGGAFAGGTVVKQSGMAGAIPGRNG